LVRKQSEQKGKHWFWIWFPTTKVF